MTSPRSRESSLVRRIAPPLQLPAFRLYFVGQLLSTFGDSLVPLTIAFAAMEVGGAGALGLVLAANRVPIAVLVLFGGALGDRWDRRRVMLGADLLRCGAQVATGALLVAGAAGVGHLVVLQALVGVGTAFFTPAAGGLVPSLVPGEQLQRANALLGLTANTNKVVSISTAGVLVATVGPGVALLVDAGTFAASAVVLWFMRLPAQVRETSRRSLWSDIRSGARLVVETPWLRTLLCYSALLQALVIGPHMVAGPLVAVEAFGGAGTWATIGAVQAVGSILGGIIALRWQPQNPLLALFVVSLLMVPYLLLFAGGLSLWLVAPAAILLGVQGAMFFAVQATMVQKRVPEQAVSRVLAWSQLGNLVLLPVSLAVTGPLAREIGAQPVLYLGTVWLLISTVIAVFCTARGGTSGKKASPANVAGEAATR